MNRVFCKLLPLLLSLIMIIGVIAPPSAAAAGIIFSINGINSPTSYIMKDGRLTVPAAYFREMGVSVNWNEENQAVVLKRGEVAISLPTGTKYAYYLSGSQWVKETLDTATKDKTNGTYIPLRYAVEKLGMKITYLPQSSKIFIKTENFATLAALSDEGIRWLYKLTEAEAGGESRKGKIAVAATVLNRMESPEYPNNMKDVIFHIVEVNGKQYYQYSPVLDGRIYDADPSQDTIDAVNEALEGKDPTGGALTFFNPDKTDNQWVRSRPVSTTIGNHVFAN
ncbi:cell wall hydrolase [Paenibacillus alkalitolerans]|uniref:cell wall hydrolase n=1 Tax=Paenibacillus alkalitolerans TaxID=2799335 RepID=UPI0018F49395|nr:cell wall hydrolase [Paenibacillus alkalitolerans]